MRFRGLDEKLREAGFSVIPIVVIVCVLCFLFVPATTGIMLSFTVGALFLIFGLGLFSYGAENSLTRIGTNICAKLTVSRSIKKILIISFILGIICRIRSSVCSGCAVRQKLFKRRL